MRYTFKNTPFFILSIIALYFCSACTIFTIKDDVEHVESLALVQGKIENLSGIAGDVYVFLLKNSVSTIDIIDYYPVNNDGSYLFYGQPGDYYIASFVDQSADGKYQHGEPADFLKHGDMLPRKIYFNENTTVNLSITAPLSYEQPAPLSEKLPTSVTKVGKIASLDDSKFSSENAGLGLWQPYAFFDKGNSGLYMLQAYDPNKTPIIFIHGINGTPTQFTKIINSLDHQHFQPWVLYYPSGIRLDIVSDYFLKGINELAQQHGFTNIDIVAHSLGGLVLRSFVQKNALTQNTLKINTAVTINSPLLGMSMAAKGVKNSPIVIPVWRDLAPNSRFIALLHEQPWPKDIPYYLFFSYLDDEDGDGVVPLSKQLSPALQNEADKIMGFNAEHSQALDKGEVIKQLNKVLNR